MADRPVGRRAGSGVARLEVGDELCDRGSRAPEEAGTDVEHDRGVLLGGGEPEEVLDRLDGPRPLQSECDPATRRELGDRAYETAGGRARDLGVDAGMREPVVLPSGLAGWQLLDVPRGREVAAGRTPDRVLVERLVPARPDPGQAQRQERLERAAQLVLLRQLLGVQAGQLGRVWQESCLCSQHC